eukprot:388464-Rhodomonas_salina.1
MAGEDGEGEAGRREEGGGGRRRGEERGRGERREGGGGETGVVGEVEVVLVEGVGVDGDAVRLKPAVHLRHLSRTPSLRQLPRFPMEGTE